MKRLLPDTIFARLFLLVLAAIVVSHLMTFVLLLLIYGERPPHHHPPGERPPAMRGAGPPASGFAPPGVNSVTNVTIAGHAIRRPPLSFWVAVASQLFALSVAAWFGARMLARPIQRLAHAASRLGVSLDQPAIGESGSSEERQAARTFNRMQQRIRQGVEERGRFLAAVSHDLRTPLTRMKLRVERLPDPAARDKLSEDIAEMAAMLNATLNYLRDEASAEDWQLLDVTALLESMVEDAVENGLDVSLSGTARPLSTRPLALRRCLSNLLQNALRYGHCARVLLQDAQDSLAIEVRDAGPGIPQEQMEQVFEPFVRLENSRNRATGGVGLGLAIAREAANQCGGKLSLANAPEGGLIARIELARMPQRS